VHWNDPVVVVGAAAVVVSLCLGAVQVILWLLDRSQRREIVFRELCSLVDAAAREFSVESHRALMIIPPPKEPGKLNALVNSPLFFRAEIRDNEREAFRRAEQLIIQPARYAEELWQRLVSDAQNHNKLCDEIEGLMAKIRPLLSRLHVPVVLESPKKLPQRSDDAQ